MFTSKNVRLWHIADVDADAQHVPAFRGKADIRDPRPDARY